MAKLLPRGEILIFFKGKGVRSVNRVRQTERDEISQVWVCVVPREEAVLRIMDRDGRSREEAEKRVGSQLSNAGNKGSYNQHIDILIQLSERVSRASTVLCTLWQPEVTQRQVEEAVKRLQGELGINGTSS